MYRATLGKEIFAAKCFYNLGRSESTISIADNRRHLEHELSRHVIATNIGKEFLQHARRYEVTVANFTFSESWISIVQTGEIPGWSYLMAPMLSSPDVVKFSGTMVAGSNDSIPGQTMDAFAHFSLIFTNEQLVLADIQGILTPQLRDGFRVSDLLTLFDLMTHTSDGKSGLGDHGEKGISEFKMQHRCNSLCKSLRFLDLGTKTSTKRSRASYTSTRTTAEEELLRPPSTAISSGKRSRRQSLTSVVSNDEVFQCEITMWGRRLDADGLPVEGEMIPKEGDELTGNLRISLDQGELYNMNRSRFWKVSLSETGVAEAYMSHIAIAPEATSIIAEMNRFHNLQSLYEEFETFAKSRNVEIINLGFDYRLIRIKVQSGHTKEWLCAQVPAFSQVFYGDFDREPTNALINDTLNAFSHFLYERYENKLVHTSWAYMHMANNHARIIAATTHDDREVSREDEESMAPTVQYFPHNLEAVGIKVWERQHKCSQICTDLEFKSISQGA